MKCSKVSIRTKRRLKQSQNWEQVNRRLSIALIAVNGREYEKCERRFVDGCDGEVELGSLGVTRSVDRAVDN